jgi:hypothetical protein
VAGSAGTMAAMCGAVGAPIMAPWFPPFEPGRHDNYVVRQVPFFRSGGMSDHVAAFRR